MSPVVEALEPLQRELGSYSSGIAGPLTVIVGGLHGNEPAGVLAARRVLRQLGSRRPALRGRLVALAGNVSALRQSVRFVERDLNRLWTEGEVGPLHGSGERASDPPLSASDDRREQVELLALIEGELARLDPKHGAIFLDLHSTSGGGPPFAIIGDTLHNRRLALALGIPVILGLEETVDGTLLGWLAGRGHTAVGIEGGQNQAPQTVDNHEAAIWVALVASGQLEAHEVPDLAAHRVRLAAAASGTPRIVEIRYRHGLEPDERFEMEPGYANFDSIDEGQLLARSWTSAGSQEVRSRERGVLLMPRYQGQGLDGFFVGRAVRPVWLWLSVWLRRLHASTLLSLLPGVSQPAGEGGPLHVDRRIARWFSVELFHLLGYRKHVAEGRRLVFSRRLERPPR
jgi:succinylglutamate desuccinylase